MERRVIFSRWFFTLICLAIMISSCISIIVCDTKGNMQNNLFHARRQLSSKMYWIITPMFLVIPIILSVLIINLIIRLKLKLKTMNQASVPNIFGKEMRNLILILILFDLSFAIRFLFDKMQKNFFDENECLDSEGRVYFCYPYSRILYDQITQYFWDYIPIISILIFHKLNFTVRETAPELFSAPFCEDLQLNAT